MVAAGNQVRVHGKVLIRIRIMGMQKEDREDLHSKFEKPIFQSCGLQ